MDAQKRCGFCDFRTTDPAQFAEHVRAAHPSFLKRTPRRPGLDYEGALMGLALLVGGFCGFVALMLPNGGVPTLGDVPAIYMDWLRIFGVVLVPLAALLGLFFPRRSYRWGLLIGWGMLPVSALYAGVSLVATLFGPLFGFTDTRESFAATAYFAAPGLLVGLLCATAWLAAGLRQWIRPG